MKSLKQIQQLSRIGLILSRIKFIFSVIGFFGCIAGLIGVLFGNGSSVKIGNLVLHRLVDTDAGFNIKSISASLAAWLVICIGGVVVAWFAKNYFSNELTAGTPFTRSGAKELKRLGILVIVIPLGTSMLAEIVQAVVTGMLHVTSDVALKIWDGDESSVILGIAFVIIALLCNYGAEQLEEKEEK